MAENSIERRPDGWYVVAKNAGAASGVVAGPLPTEEAAKKILAELNESRESRPSPVIESLLRPMSPEDAWLRKWGEPGLRVMEAGGGAGTVFDQDQPVMESRRITEALAGKWDSKTADGRWRVSVRVGGKGEEFVGQAIRVEGGASGSATVKLIRLVQDYGPGDVAVFDVEKI